MSIDHYCLPSLAPGLVSSQRTQRVVTSRCRGLSHITSPDMHRTRVTSHHQQRWGNISQSEDIILVSRPMRSQKRLTFGRCCADNGDNIDNGLMPQGGIMTRKTPPWKGKGWHRFHVRSGLSCHKTDALRKRNIYHTSGAKYQERSAGKTLSLVTRSLGLGVIIARFPLEALSPGVGSCVRIDLNHLSRHEHSRRRRAEKVLKKNESQRCVKGERGRLMNY